MSATPDASTPEEPTESLNVTEWPPVSVVIPVLNEERYLRKTLEHVMTQEYPGELEVILALGPSNDRTDEIAATLAAADPRLRSVPNPTGGIAAGVNHAIRASAHPVLVRVDGHGMLSAGYIRTAVDVLQRTGAANVGGLMAAEGETDFEKAVAAAMTSPLGVGSARFHTGGEEGPSDTVYLGVFRRAILDQVGGYNELFGRAEDWELNHRIKLAGGLVWFTPDLRVSYRPRPTLVALAKQYFHYGRWRRVVAHQHRGTVSLRYLAPPAAVLAIAAGSVVGVLVNRLGLVVPAAYAVGVLAGSAVIGRGLPWRSRLALPAVLATMHVSWGIGFLTSPHRLRRAVAANSREEPVRQPGH
jgi:GT2 family glycosyltransferase